MIIIANDKTGIYADRTAGLTIGLKTSLFIERIVLYYQRFIPSGLFFGQWQGAKRAHSRSSVTDEQRSH